MKSEELYRLIELPSAVTKELQRFSSSDAVLTPLVREMLSARKTWEEGVRLLQNALGDDPNGMKILRVMLNLACETYLAYQSKGIPQEIFAHTMKFCTRFIKSYHALYGEYKFEWAWWLPRQLFLKEFRIGSLEYEFVEEEQSFISVHIPADADLRPAAVSESLGAFFEFRKKFFPEWQNLKLYCESWLLSPALKKLLKADSNILHFQSRFVVESTDYESLAVLDWVFPGHREVSEKLPEKTSLQKNMKRFMLGGGKVGWSKGCLRSNQ